jgi:hypothetical protein
LATSLLFPASYAANSFRQLRSWSTSAKELRAASVQVRTRRNSIMAAVEKISALLRTKLGRCPRCMRQSFFFVISTWGLVHVTTLVTISPLVRTSATVIAVTATGVWLSHLAAYALRATRHLHTATEAVMGRNIITALSLHPRRQFVLAFSKSFLVAATAAALPIGAVFAQSKLQQCLTCCASRLSACGNDGKCNTLYQNCASSCNSQGEAPSDWKCW